MLTLNRDLDADEEDWVKSWGYSLPSPSVAPSFVYCIHQALKALLTGDVMGVTPPAKTSVGKSIRFSIPVGKCLQFYCCRIGS